MESSSFIEHSQLEIGPDTSNTEGEEVCGVFGTIFNTVNTMVGAGILSLGYAFYKTGYVLGILIMVIIGVFSTFPSYFLSRAATISKRSTFQAISRGIPGLGYTFDVSAFGSTFSTTTAYVLFVTQFITVFLDIFIEKDTIFKERFFLGLWVTLVLYLLCAFRNISALQYTSFLSFFFMLITLLGVLLYYIAYSGNSGAKPFSFPTAFSGLPFMIASYSIHFNVPRLFHEMRKGARPVLRFTRIVTVANVFGFLLSSALGLLSYLTFGEDIEDNLLYTYDIVFSGASAFQNAAQSILVVAIICYGFLILFSFPLLAHCQRMMIEGWCFASYKNHYIRLLFLDLALVSVSAVISLEVNSISFLIGSFGSVFDNLVIYILPSVVVIVYYRRRIGFTGKMVVVACLSMILGCIGFTIAIANGVLFFINIGED